MNHLKVTQSQSIVGTGQKLRHRRAFSHCYLQILGTQVEQDTLPFAMHMAKNVQNAIRYLQRASEDRIPGPFPRMSANSFSATSK